MSLLPATAHRVETNTDAAANQRIHAAIEVNVRYYAQHPEQIEQRLQELDREWDIERVLEANAASLAFGGTVLGLLRHRGFLILPLLVAGFLLQHALQGWCPPVPMLRRRGVRTAAEIERERAALKALRGDFVGAQETHSTSARADSAWAAARA